MLVPNERFAQLCSSMPTDARCGNGALTAPVYYRRRSLTSRRRRRRRRRRRSATRDTDNHLPRQLAYPGHTVETPASFQMPAVLHFLFLQSTSFSW